MNPREVILNILIDINIDNAYSNHSINKHLKQKQNIKDENLIREIVYGVIENLSYIDYIIAQSSKIKIKKIQPVVLQILRMGVYQIAFMDKIPDRAAVNEAVNLSKKRGHKGVSGFVNGVLRNISRNKAEFMKISEKDEIEYLSIQYSHPKWMVKSWIEEYGYEFTEKLCSENNSKAKLNIRVNTNKIALEELVERLSSQGYTTYRTPYAKDGLIVEKPSRITEIDEFKLGLFTIQDESSMLVGQIANPKENSIVLDLCSAPGGKSTHIAQLMNNKGRVISRDIYEHKLKLVRENANRLNLSIIETESFDALKLDESLIEQVDYCLVDPPCSGLGIIRRSPEIKWNRKKEDMDKLNKLQRKILDNSKEYIKPGGIIIYSTCTFGGKENLDIINEFLDKNNEFKLVGFENLLSVEESLCHPKKGYIQLYPHIHGTDGFFIAKIQRNYG